MHGQQLVVQWLHAASSDLQKAMSALETENAAETQWVRTVAHRLNNQLTVTMQLIDLMMADLSELADVDVVVRLQELHHFNERMAETVRQFLASTRTWELTLTREEVDIASKANAIESHFRAQAVRKNISFSLDVEPGLPSVSTNRVSLLEILENLVSNAIKFSPLGTKVSMRVWREAGEIILSVADEGPGLTRDDKAHLFEPGVRLSAKPTAGELSTGFGLAVSKRLAESICARLWCVSNPGEGATFFLALPA
jgi:two-component system sensor histidine kinase/response regulator